MFWIRRGADVRCGEKEKAVFVKIVVFNEIHSKSLNGQQFVQMFSNIKDV